MQKAWRKMLSQKKILISKGKLQTSYSKKGTIQTQKNFTFMF